MKINKDDDIIDKIIVECSKEEPQQKYKIIIGGTLYCSKTAYFNRLFDNTFDPNAQGSDLGYRYANLRIDDLILKFETWDTVHWAGKFNPFVKVHITEANGFLLLFNLNNKENFNNLKKCYNLIKENISDLSKIHILLLEIHSDKDNYMMNIDS